jgi:zinc protease
VTSYIGDTDEGIAGGASPKDLETMFQLIYLNFTAPRADPAVFEVLKSQMKAMLANQQASPDWAFRQMLQATLAQDHPRARMMTPEMVDQMDLQKSFAFYRDRFADASDFTFVFTGSFELDAMRPLVEQYLASLPSTGRKESWRDVGIRPPKGVVERVVRRGIEPKSQVDIVFSGPMSFDAGQQVALDALALVLENRLRLTLREALRGTYGVGVEAIAQNVPNPEYSLTIDFGCDPQRTEELVKSVFKDIEALRAAPPTEQEVADAREGLLRQHESALAQNNRLVSELIERYHSSQDIAEFFALPGAYQRLTASAIQSAARRYMDPGNFVRVTLMPEK